MTRMLNFEIWNTNTCILCIGTIYGSPPDDKPLSGSRTGAHFGKLSYTVETPNAMCEDILKRYIDPIIVRIPRGEGVLILESVGAEHPPFLSSLRLMREKTSVIRPLSAWNLVVTKLLYCILSSTPLFHHQGGVDIAGWGWFCQGGVDFFRVGLIFSGWGWRSSPFHKHEIAYELALSIH